MPCPIHRWNPAARRGPSCTCPEAPAPRPAGGLTDAEAMALIRSDLFDQAAPSHVAQLTRDLAYLVHSFYGLLVARYPGAPH